MATNREIVIARIFLLANALSLLIMATGVGLSLWYGRFDTPAIIMMGMAVLFMERTISTYRVVRNTWHISVF